MGKGKAGRPSLDAESLYKKYVEGHEDELRDACENGFDNKGIGAILGCKEGTVCRLKRECVRFAEMVKEWSIVADEKVESSLFRRAIGYDAEETFTEVKVSPDGSAQTTYVKKVKKHIPGDTTAMIFWLKNRKSGYWRDRVENSVIVNDMPKIDLRFVGGDDEDEDDAGN